MQRDSRIITVVVLMFVGAVYVAIPKYLQTRISAHQAQSLALLKDEADVADAASGIPERKIIRTTTLGLLVEDTRKTAPEVEKLAVRFGGYVEKMEISQAKDLAQHAELLLRVPATRLDDVRSEIKRLARLVESDKTEARDVTKEFVDSEARLRNYRAEERQYLEIMRHATKVADTLNTAEHLSEVRGRIEQLQGELKYLSQQVEMASISVNLRVESTRQSAQWQPWYNTKLAFADMVDGLVNFADWVIYVILMLPVILLWVVTIALLVLTGIRLVVWGKRRFPIIPKPLPADERHQS